MKNIRLLAPLILAGLVAFYAIGCGSNATGGGSGGGGGGSSYTGRLSDPYVDGAIVICDMNGSGSYDATVTGEMIATTDAFGGFTFPATPQIGATIEQVSSGEHLGADYDGEWMKKTVDNSGLFNVTPLTNWETHGITAEEIAALISASGIAIPASYINNDPMSGLSNISTFDTVAAINAVKAIKAAIMAYSVSQIAIDQYGADYDKDDLESTLMRTVEAAVASAVNSGISDSLLITINNKIHDINVSLEARGLQAVPLATADQISRSSFLIAQYIAYMKINNSSSAYDWWPAGFDAATALYGQSLGMRYYFMDNYNYGAPASSYAPPGIAGKTSIVIGLEQGNITDGFGNRITTVEVNPGSPDYVVGYRIITTAGPTQGTIEALY